MIATEIFHNFTSLMRPTANYVCVNPLCKYSTYNNPEMFFSYSAPCHKSCPYCHGLLYTFPETGISHTGTRVSHLFTDIVSQRDISSDEMFVMAHNKAGDREYRIKRRKNYNYKNKEK